MRPTKNINVYLEQRKKDVCIVLLYFTILLYIEANEIIWLTILLKKIYTLSVESKVYPSLTNCLTAKQF